jgi:capsular exopolysaccharide synthesis family protein
MCYTTKGEKCAVYGISSAYVSAGKSLIMANIAVSFAQMNKKVLLIDGDLRCPVQHKIFNLDNKINGFSDLLAGICTYEDLYRRNGGVENLNVITSGKIPPNPAELLASPRMNEFLETVKQEYDMIFIDLPPVCEVSDAGIISDLLTGYVFVVRSGYSDRRMIELAVETMEGFNASFVGFVLNDIDIKSGDYYKNKYYSSYSKYRFRYGKSGYYRHFKYGYYKGYYSRYSRYSRYNSKYSRYGYGNSYGYGTNNYSRAHDEVNAEVEAEEIKQQAVENMQTQEPVVNANEAHRNEKKGTKAKARTAKEEAVAQKATEENTSNFRNDN